MLIKPSFYDDFECKADKCTDSCCIGWEIDIDDFSLENYNNVMGQFGEKLRNSIVDDDEFSFFKLTDDERCPFLMNNGLCEIYSQLGKDSLCDICAEHPRFYNETADVTEVGLGLCCERVCEMLFDKNYTLEFISDGNISSDCDYNRFVKYRKKIFDYISSPEDDIITKMNNIIGKNEISADNTFMKKVISAFLLTEPVNDDWTRYINDLQKNISKLKFPNLHDCDYNKLLIYLIYRHLPFVGDEINSWLMFCCINVYFVLLCDAYSVFLKGTFSMSDRIENVKRWSKQIEYSTENVDIIRKYF